jgi:hypothetical protein
MSYVTSKYKRSPVLVSFSIQRTQLSSWSPFSFSHFIYLFIFKDCTVALYNLKPLYKGGGYRGLAQPIALQVYDC